MSILATLNQDITASEERGFSSQIALCFDRLHSALQLPFLKDIPTSHDRN